MLRNLIILTFFIFSIITPMAESQTMTEHEIKAGFIYNFIKYVEWPSELSGSKDDSINICIIGEDPSRGAFQSLQGKIVHDRKILLKTINTMKAAKGCHVLFISPSEKENLRQIMTTLKGSGILTIGEVDGWAQEGVIINFYMDKSKIRFEVNIDNASRSKLKISSHLLKLARIIRDAY